MMLRPRPMAVVALCMLGLGVSAPTTAQERTDPFAPTDPPPQPDEPTSLPTQVPAPPSLRLHVEGALTRLYSDTTRWPDGSSASPSCIGPVSCAYGLAAGLGVDWSVHRRFGLGLRARLLRHFEGDVSIFGRQLYVVDVLLVPQVNLPWYWRRFPRGGARPYLAAPVGLAWSIQTRNWTRAVSEEWNGRPGLSVGVALGLELFWSRHWGGLVELGYQARFLSADVISTPIDEPQARVSERVSTRQHQILLSFGALFGLNP